MTDTVSSNPLACPACSYERKPHDTAPATLCPACGVVFAQFHKEQARRQHQAAADAAQAQHQAEKAAARAKRPPWWLTLMIVASVFAISFAVGTWQNRP